MMGTTPVLYVPGGADTFYALNAITGAIIWQTSLGSPSAETCSGASPLLYNGNVYEGVASFGDCPLVQGQLVEMNADTGAIEHVADMVPNGCIGGGIWSSPAPRHEQWHHLRHDRDAERVRHARIAPAIVQLPASNLTILSSWTIPPDRLILRSRLRLDPDPLYGHHRRSGAAAGRRHSTRTASSTPGTGTNRRRSGVGGEDRRPCRQSPRSSRPLGTGLELYIGGGNTIINGTSCYENHLRPQPGDGSLHLAAIACRAV